MPTLMEIATLFFLQMFVIMATYRLIWPLFRKLAQVQVVVMVAGSVLGPSVLGLLWPTAQHWLFPPTVDVGGTSITHPNLTAIYVVGQLGVVLYMFLVGTSFKLDILGSHIRQAGATSAAGVGLLADPRGNRRLDHGLIEHRLFTAKVEPWQGSLFIAAAVAVTAFPMLAWIIYDSGLLNTRLGTMSADVCSSRRRLRLDPACGSGRHVERGDEAPC